jgi:hypothetical protein
LCDSAATAEGKLYLQGGGWSMLGTPSFPFHKPRIGLGVVIGVPYTATNQNHVLSIRLENEDGQRIAFGPATDGEQPGEQASIGLQGRFDLGRPPHLQPGDAQTIPFAINLDQLRFDSPGAYALVIEINHVDIERLIFRVVSPVEMISLTGS